ncbi:MAG: AMP-binding protein [Candidatus Microthrix sp.]|nr:AMP-binding protein [Candidatus Microthrix sp.]
MTMPLPMRMGAIDQFIAQTRARILRSDTKIVVIDADLAAFIEREPGDPPFVTLDELFAVDGPAESDYLRPPSDPDALAVLQFTSGSTSEPKGVMLPHRAVCNNLDGAWSAARITHDEVIVSWLPLYHDMGLIGLLTIPMSTGLHPGTGHAPQDFLSRPSHWMRWISDHGGDDRRPRLTMRSPPGRLRRTEDLDLSSLGCCSNSASRSTRRSSSGSPDRRRSASGFRPGAAFPY